MKNSNKRFALFTWSRFLLFWFFLFRDQVFRNQNRDFFSRPNFPKPKFSFRDQIHRNQNRDIFLLRIFSKPKPRLFFETKFSKTEIETFFKPNFLRPKQNPSKKPSRNRNVNLCHSVNSFGSTLPDQCKSYSVNLCARIFSDECKLLSVQPFGASKLEEDF